MNKYKAVKSFDHDQIGLVEAGTVIEFTEAQADTPLYRGDVELYETKVVTQKAVKPQTKAKGAKDDNSGESEISAKAE